MDFTAYADGRTIVDVAPDTKAKASRALSNVRGESDDQVRCVHMHRQKIETFTVHGPRDGRPLLIDVWVGMPRLQIESGNVVVHADSTWGNSIDVSGDAHVTVVTSRRVKVSASVHDRASLMIQTAPECHGYIGSDSSEATIVVQGGDHQFTVRTPDGVTRAGHPAAL